ncbi:MAG: amino acid adenylation domain-containing protein, partial [Defluviitaleaceae bacterium]|nr:amino acid adenylation domain-containing protein [Defluviitaleaceae bacterium]
ARANALAHKLRELGVGPDDYVGIMAERSIEMIVGIYGIIKAGGAYVPIDPTYPAERIQYILEDCNPKVMLTYQVEIEASVSTIDLDNSEIWRGENENPARVNKSSDLIYCIYTSGTTGKPKGVMVEHKSVLNLAIGQIGKYEITESDYVLQFTSIYFDPSVEQIFISHFSGASLYLIDDETILDPFQFNAFMSRNKITHLNCVPSFLEGINLKGLIDLKRVVVGGEVFPVKLATALDIEAEIYNAYGPTETTVTAIMSIVEPTRLHLKIPIGNPISNTQVYIMKGDMLCGIGIPGELCIAGAGVARGYLNSPDLTAERFVDNPYGEGRLYSTGDLARWLPDGNIEYLGRIDEQVKIRGFRIELGEIMSALQKLDEIKDNVVLIREDQNGTAYLCAYLVSNGPLDFNLIKEKLSNTLPGHMVPTAYIELDELPLTSNGKIDRRKLMSYEIDKTNQVEYIEAKTETEKKLVEIWKEVLNLEQVGIKDNFFNIGGHSLKVITMLSKINDVFSKKISIIEILKNCTIYEIGKLLDSKMFVNDSEKNSLTLLREAKDSNHDVYFVFDVTGNIGYSINLIDKLCVNANIYGVDFGELDNNIPMNITMDDLANKYLKEILPKSKNKKRIDLIGWSFGGLLAHHIAEILIMKGIKNTNIVMIDSPIISNSMQTFVFNDKYETSFLKDIDKNFEKGGIRKINFKQYLTNNQSKKEFQFLANDYDILKYHLKDISYTKQEFMRQLNIMRTLKRIIESYEFRIKFNKKIMYIKAEETGEKNILNLLKWSRSNTLKVYTVKGDHFTVVNNVEEMIKILNKCFE